MFTAAVLPLLALAVSAVPMPGPCTRTKGNSIVAGRGLKRTERAGGSSISNPRRVSSNIQAGDDLVQQRLKYFIAGRGYLDERAIAAALAQETMRQDAGDEEGVQLVALAVARGAIG